MRVACGLRGAGAGAAPTSREIILPVRVPNKTKTPRVLASVVDGTVQDYSTKDPTTLAGRVSRQYGVELVRTPDGARLSALRGSNHTTSSCAPPYCLDRYKPKWSDPWYCSLELYRYFFYITKGPGPYRPLRAPDASPVFRIHDILTSAAARRR